jgi:polysaccharide biosynthesis PFTS motif protein
LFHNSGWVYRPLWTYDAEQLGARITFYFYSTNCETLKRPDGETIRDHSWRAMNWPRYVVWDGYQAEFVRDAVGDGPAIEVAGSIGFSTSARELPDVPRDAIAVFDVQPWRASGYRALGLAEEYYTPTTASRFLLDIHAAARQYGVPMLLKRKREIGKWLHPRYAAVVEQLGASDHFIAVDPDISATRVIEASGVAISMPFTSTALLAREIGKASIYYDPYGVVQKDDRAAHGIPVVTGADELKRWLSDHLVGPVSVRRPVAR